MPKKNAVKIYAEESYYHVYNRGAGKHKIFIDKDDYEHFLGLLKGRLASEMCRDAQRRVQANYSDAIELVAYCLMPNHYHMLLYLRQAYALESFMRSIMTAYGMYFNRKYKRSGTLFEGPYLASTISSDEYLWHVSRYIHLNALDIAQDPLSYRYSSIGYFIGSKHAAWINVERLVESEEEQKRYKQFVQDGASYHNDRRTLKHLLADS